MKRFANHPFGVNSGRTVMQVLRDNGRLKREMRPADDSTNERRQTQEHERKAQQPVLRDASALVDNIAALRDLR